MNNPGYIFPYARQGIYFCSRRSMAGDQSRDLFDFTTGTKEESVPKISIHESGQVHIRTGKAHMEGCLRIPELRSLHGEHVASVVPDTFDALPLFSEEPKTDGAERDIMLVESEINGFRIAIFVNGHEARFLGVPPPSIMLAMQRPSGNTPLYVGLKVLVQQPIGEEGTTVIAGWNPRTPNTEPMEYLIVRGT